MMMQVSHRKSVKVFLSSIFATLLISGRIVFAPLPGGDGAVWARDLGGGKVARGGENRARPQRQSASKIDRKPRASSADRGSMRRASAKRPSVSAQAKARKVRAEPQTGLKPRQRASTDRAKVQSKAQPPKAERSARNEPFVRKDRSGTPQKTASADRQAKQGDLRAKGADRQQSKAQLREEHNKQIKEGRKQYAENQQDIRNERKKAMEELQQNKSDHRDEAREDWQDHMDDARKDRHDFQEDMADERRDLYEDIYDDRRYWGNDSNYWDDDDDDEDDNGWLWGIAGAAAGGLAGYAIGAAVNEPPEGTVAVPVGGVPYQYYGGAFYAPAPSGAGYVTTPAPVGAQVEAPPIDCTIVFGPEDEGYCYFQGAFFIYDDAANQYVVVVPPAGTSVTYLPPGYEEVSVEGTKYLKLGGTYYRPYYEGDEVVYVVSKVS
jgi:hypothetical protein